MARPLASSVEIARLDPPMSGLPLAPYTFEDLVERIRAEFIEQPGLRLTEAQASRLWQLDSVTSRRVLTSLLETAFLSCTADGRYVRRSLV
jgi:hypothetical protein